MKTAFLWQRWTSIFWRCNHSEDAQIKWSCLDKMITYQNDLKSWIQPFWTTQKIFSYACDKRNHCKFGTVIREKRGRYSKPNLKKLSCLRKSQILWQKFNVNHKPQQAIFPRKRNRLTITSSIAPDHFATTAVDGGAAAVPRLRDLATVPSRNPFLKRKTLQ